MPFSISICMINPVVPVIHDLIRTQLHKWNLESNWISLSVPLQVPQIPWSRFMFLFLCRVKGCWGTNPDIGKGFPRYKRCLQDGDILIDWLRRCRHHHERFNCDVMSRHCGGWPYYCGTLVPAWRWGYGKNTWQKNSLSSHAEDHPQFHVWESVTLDA